ncbi:MAG: DUF1697 domain-containing protein [Candidatus Acidiferrales bacterium]
MGVKKQARTKKKVRGRCVALLRGINLGPHKRMSMKDLVVVFEKCGCSEVTTYIQSGNVAFTAPVGGIDAAILETHIAKRFGFEAPVVLRTTEELEAVIAANPYPKCDQDKDRPHVSFLADLPLAENVALLDPMRSPGDSFTVLGREVYLLFPTGLANNKLTSQYLDSRLKTMGTARNWRTVLALAEMARREK